LRASLTAGEDMIQMSTPPPTQAPSMSIKPASQVVAQVVSFLWPERIPEGKLLLLDGDPDLGKSLIALDLCARLSTGRAFPDGRPGPGPVNALVLSAEDNAADTVVPRLRQLGADTGCRQSTSGGHLKEDAMTDAAAPVLTQHLERANGTLASRYMSLQRTVVPTG
jgi:hypothetical protein